MSTILKALKKLEERKAASGQRQGDIAWDILREEPRSGNVSSFGTLWVGAGLLLALALLVLFFFITRPYWQRLEVVPVEAAATDRAGAAVARPAPPPVRVATPPSSRDANRGATVAPSAVPEALDAVPEGVSLVISGIAFQQDPESRIAIVNDLPVMVGTVIEGVVVEQIDPDRVVFSHLGHRFAVALNSSR